MPTNTYIALDKVTTTGSVAFIEFTSISSSYTDLRIVIDVVGVGTGYVTAQFNSDTGSNYSLTRLGGNGSTASSNRATSQTSCDLSWSAAYTSSGRLFETVDIMNYSDSTTYKTLFSRAGKADNALDTIVGLWRSTSAITSIKLIAGSANFAAGSTFSLYGIAAEGAYPAAKATGGTVSYSVDGYTYHTFTSSGTFTPTSAFTAEVLVVAGGGSGGYDRGGGGGAGGLSYHSGKSLSVTGYTVTVGAGGTTQNGYSQNNPGSNSVFDNITSNGGGAGPSGNDPGRNGGSGSGSAQDPDAGLATQGNTGGATGYGNNGGVGTQAVGSNGGGGGAGAVGGAGTSGQSGAGGAGLNTWSSWATATGTGASGYYAGGGGGGAAMDGATAARGLGGAGGGGAGGSGAGGAGTAGTVNTGGGGGGGSNSPQGNGGAGGSGIVIIRYASV